MALSLSKFRHCISSSGTGNVCELASGAHEVDATLAIGRSNIEVCGVVRDGSAAPILRRSKTATGELFAGSLISAAGVSNVVIRDLEINGARFGRNGEVQFDYRHPSDSDPGSSLFLYPKQLPSPVAGAPPAVVPEFEADLYLTDANQIAISNVIINQPVRHGIAIGNDARDITIARVTVRRAGDYGLWIGLASPTRPPLPLTDRIAESCPRRVRIEECRMEDCGSAGVFIEGIDVALRSCTLERNHRDFPYNSDGGQVEIDYKADDITVESCAILAGPSLERSERIFRCVGIEAYGSHLLFKNNRIEGNSHEGIHLNGARYVTICGSRTMIANNHTAGRLYPSVSRDPVQNISITTAAELAQLNAFGTDIRIEGITCEHGIVVWTNGSVERLQIDGMTVTGCKFPCAAGDGIVVGRNADGSSIRGVGWNIGQGWLQGFRRLLNRRPVFR